MPAQASTRDLKREVEPTGLLPRISEKTLTQIDLPGGRGSQVGEGSPRFVLVSGAPVGAALFRTVQERLRPHASLALELDVPEVEGPQLFTAMGAALGNILDQVGASTVLVHGTAAPLARALPKGCAQHVVVSNGPLGKADPVLAALSRLPLTGLEQALLRPEVLQRWFRSSLGLRRLVTNPYAMHRDIVVMLCEGWTASPQARHGAARWLKAFSHPLPSQSDPDAHLGAIWGDHDRLHPVAEVESIAGGWAGFELIRIPGGRMFCVEERPWAVAEALLDLVGPG